jgi:hypothetical protein
LRFIAHRGLFERHRFDRMSAVRSTRCRALPALVLSRPSFKQSIDFAAETNSRRILGRHSGLFRLSDTNSRGIYD